MSGARKIWADNSYCPFSYITESNDRYSRYTIMGAFGNIHSSDSVEEMRSSEFACIYATTDDSIVTNGK